MRSDGLKNWGVLSRDEKSEIKMLIDQEINKNNKNNNFSTVV